MSMLEVENLVVSYGAIKALKGISFNVEKGEVITLIGSNGAGKTTTLHSISNLVKKASGTIKFEGKDITNMSADKIVQLGLIQVPEGRRVFANMSVKENLEMGAYSRKDKDAIKTDMEWCFELFPRLKERIGQISGTLSGGEQQMLAMARALMSKPSLLLLDEPSMGLAPKLMFEMFRALKQLNFTRQMTILVVEQNAKVALDFADRGYVLATGEIIASGTSEQLRNNPEVQKAYLGG